MKAKRAVYLVFKRCFDLLASSLAIIVTSPFWLVAAIGIKVSSKGPVFYKSTRIGKDSKSFTLYKFRSMHVYHPSDANDTGKGGTGFIADENRIFKFGGFLRKSKLDELPQLLNILFSQMSVIGPRPMTSDKFFKGEYAVIPTVKPGLSCLDSLFDYAHGELFVHDNEEYKKNVLPARTELAKIYVEKQSIGLDTYCIFRTIKLVFEIVVSKKKKFAYTKYEAEAYKRVQPDMLDK